MENNHLDLLYIVIITSKNSFWVVRVLRLQMATIK